MPMFFRHKQINESKKLKRSKLDTEFFSNLSSSRGFRPLPQVNLSPWQTPCARLGRSGALDQQQLSISNDSDTATHPRTI